MITSKLEVLVDFGPTPNEQDVDRTLNHLKSQDHVTQAIFKDGAVMVETTLPSSVILDMVAKSSGRRAVLQGFGDTQSAVAMISSQCGSSRVLGVVRFSQSGDRLVADGSVDGLAPGSHGLHVHETGDLSLGCSSIGSHYNPLSAPHGAPTDPPTNRHAGDLGNILADEHGRARFRIEDSVLQINEILGRSIAVTERADDLGRGSSPFSKINGDSGTPIACGIIARSAGVFQNPKRICACDGVVVWDERDRPLAGKGRRKCCQKEENGAKMCCKNTFEENTFKDYYYKPLSDDSNDSLMIARDSSKLKGKRGEDDRLDDLFKLAANKRKKQCSSVSRAQANRGVAFISTNREDAASSSQLIKIEVYDMKKLANEPQEQHWKNANIRLKYFSNDTNQHEISFKYNSSDNYYHFARVIN